MSQEEGGQTRPVASAYWHFREQLGGVWLRRRDGGEADRIRGEPRAVSFKALSGVI